MERRQKTWHGDIASTGEFPPHETTDELAQHTTHNMSESERREVQIEHEEYLCLRLVDRVRMVMKGINIMPRKPEKPVEE